MLPILTKRLSIRRLNPDDWEHLFAYRSDPEICKFQSYEPYTAEKCKAFAENQSHVSYGAAGVWVQWGIELNAEKKLIGDIGLRPDEDDTRIVTFGITVASHYQGFGYAREAMRSVLDHLFKEQEVNRVTGIVDQENAGSIQLLQHLGFRKEGHTKESFWNNGMWRDEFIFALLKKEWSVNCEQNPGMVE